MSELSDRKKGSDQRRQPKQSRSVETRKSILKAASSLFVEQGYEKTTTHQIAAQAEVSVGALYRYFSDKEAILKEIYRIEMSVLRDRILEEFSTIEVVDQDVRNMIREALRKAFEVFSEDAGLRKVLSDQSQKIPELIDFRRKQEEELYETVGNILDSVPLVDLPDVKVGAYLISLFLEKLIEDFFLYRRDHSDFTNERIIEAGTEFLVRYLKL